MPQTLDIGVAQAMAWKSTEGKTHGRPGSVLRSARLPTTGARLLEGFESSSKWSSETFHMYEILLDLFAKPFIMSPFRANTKAQVSNSC
jgi:hypothetical protein